VLILKSIKKLVEYLYIAICNTQTIKNINNKVKKRILKVNDLIVMSFSVRKLLVKNVMLYFNLT